MLACLPIDPTSLCLPTPIAVRAYQCPTELPQLSVLLLRDIIPYANRAAQRRRKKIPPDYRLLDPNYSSYLAVGRTSLEPLAFDNPEYQPRRPAPQQIFLTSLEKQHAPGSQFTEIQRFHWIFLDRGQTGWRMSAIYSHVRSGNSDPLLLPPTDSLTTPLGEAIATWLRDCNAGKIRP
jgi:hypothetical protein